MDFQIGPIRSVFNGSVAGCLRLNTSGILGSQKRRNCLAQSNATGEWPLPILDDFSSVWYDFSHINGSILACMTYRSGFFWGQLPIFFGSPLLRVLR